MVMVKGWFKSLPLLANYSIYCRYLHLERCCPYFYKLAPANLEAFSFAHINTIPHAVGEQFEQPEISRITQWTDLRRLELQGFSKYPNLQPLSSLQLKDLSLINCFGGTWPIIEASAFPFLQSLHIEDKEGEAFNKQFHYLERELDRVADRILKMPHLIRLSGNGILLAMAMMGGLHPIWRLAGRSNSGNSAVNVWEKSLAS